LPYEDDILHSRLGRITKRLELLGVNIPLFQKKRLARRFAQALLRTTTKELYVKRYSANWNPDKDLVCHLRQDLRPKAP